jgi:ABC-type transport system substrate-binding protein
MLARIAVALVGALLACGCSNNPNAARWNEEGTLFVSGGEPQSFDPSVSYNAGDAGVMDLVYPCYFRYNYLKQNPWELELNLGLVEPTRTPISGTLHTKNGDVPYHGDKWTLELRHDLRFQDDPCFKGGKGRPITAKDLEYSFKRMVDPKVQFPLASNLQDKLLGWDEYAKGFDAKKKDEDYEKSYDRPLVGVRVDPHNPYRLSILLTQPYPQLRFLLAMHFTSPIAREAVETYKDDYAIRHPVGCGLYKFQEYSPHYRIVLVHNPNCTWERYPTSAAPGTPPYLLTDAGKPLPVAQRIEFNIITESITSYNLFDQGYLDELGVGQPNAAPLLHAVRPGAAMVRRGIVMLKGAYPAFEYLGFNMEDPTFGGYTPEKRKLRQAISLSVDSNAYLELMNQGLGAVIQFLLPHGIGGFDPNYKNPYRVYDSKLKRARELLKEAGYPDGVDPKTHERLTLYYDNYTDQGPSDRARESFITKQIEALGIRVISRDTDYATFTEKVNDKKAQFFNYGWVADYPDAEDFCMLLYGPDESPGPNNANYHNPVCDALFDQMRSMPDGPARTAIIRRLRDIEVEDCPMIYLCENEGPTVFQPWVRNRQSNPILVDTLKYEGVDSGRRLGFQVGWNRPVLTPLLAFLAIAVVGAAPAWRTVRRQRDRRVRRPAA